MKKILNYLIITGGCLLILLFSWYLPKYKYLSETKSNNYVLTDFIKWKETSKGLILSQKNFLFEYKTKGQAHLLKPGDLLTAVDFKPVTRLYELNEVLKKSSENQIYNYTIERDEPDLAVPLVLNYLIEIKSSPLFLLIENPKSWNLQLVINLMGFMFYMIVALILFPFFRRQNIKSSIPFLLTISCTILLFFTGLFRQLGIITGWSLAFQFLDSIGIELWILSICLTISGWFMSNTDLNNKFSYFISFTSLFPFFVFEYLYHIQEVIGINLEQYSNYLLLTTLTALFIYFSGLCFRLFFTGKKLQAILIIALSGFSIILTWIYRHPVQNFSLAAILLLSIPSGISSFRVWQLGNVRVVLTNTLLITFIFIILILFYFSIHSILPDIILKSPYAGLSEILLLMVIGIIIYGFYRLNIRLFSKFFTTPAAKKEQNFKELTQKIINSSSSLVLLDEFSNGLTEFLNSKNIIVNLAEKNIYDVEFPMQKNKLFIWSQNKILSPQIFESEIEKKLFQNDVQLLFIESLKEGKYLEVLVERKKNGKYTLGEVEKITALIKQAKLSLDLLTLLEKEKVLSNQRIEANLKALRAQINPHFLFNTLNTISSLIREKPELAEKIVDSLASMFRKTLNLSDKNLLKLEEEIGLVKDYLTIEKARFGERLQIKWNIENGTENIEIPALCIQTLIENSIKHGISKEIKKGIIEISIKKEAGFLKILITDNGSGFNLEKMKHGHGLINIQSRFLEHYGDNKLVNFKSNPGEGTEVELKVPLGDI